MTENEKVRASLPRGQQRTHASCDARPEAREDVPKLRGTWAICAKPGNAARRRPFGRDAKSVLKGNSDGY